MAKAFQMPMLLHHRNCHSDFMEIVSANRGCLVRNGVVHSFTGSLREAEDILGLGLFIGVNGCSLKTAENLEVVKEIPLSRLMIETDAPWCEVKPTHAGYKLISSAAVKLKKEKFIEGALVKGRNEPALIGEIAEIVAKIKNVSVEQVADATFENAKELFLNQWQK